MAESPSARREGFLRLQHLGPLQVADLHREVLHGGGDHRQRREVGGVPVARDHLGRDRLGDQAHLLGHVGFDARIDVGEGADRPGDGAGRHLEARHRQSLAGPHEGGVVARQLQAEGGRLGVHAVAAADRGRHLVLDRPALQRRQHQLDILHQQVGRARQLHR
jgi:hypothetical protein